MELEKYFKKIEGIFRHSNPTIPENSEEMEQQEHQEEQTQETQQMKPDEPQQDNSEQTAASVNKPAARPGEASETGDSAASESDECLGEKSTANKEASDETHEDKENEKRMGEAAGQQVEQDTNKLIETAPIETDGDSDKKGKQSEEESKRVRDKPVKSVTVVTNEAQEVTSTNTKNQSRGARSRRASYQSNRNHLGSFQNYGLTYLPYKSNFEPSEDARRRADEFLKTLEL